METIKARVERIVCSACTHKTQILWSGPMSALFRYSPVCPVRGCVHDQRHIQGIKVSVSHTVCNERRKSSEGKKGLFASCIYSIHMLDCHFKMGKPWEILSVMVLAGTFFIDLVMSSVISGFKNISDLHLQIKKGWEVLPLSYSFGFKI